MDAAYKEVSNYQDLLLLGDLATITQEKRPYSWIRGACAGAAGVLEQELAGSENWKVAAKDSKLDSGHDMSF